ncbi:hypothetical protein ACJJTC_001557 [Scirpophaga incertulas]
MAYFGKFFSVDRSEGYEDFIKALGLPEEATAKFIAYKPKTKIEKNGDTYKITTESQAGTRVVEFKSGVEFEERFQPEIPVKAVYTVEGDTITQVISKDDRQATFKREYTADTLTVTITANFWDGKAVRYYKAE